ncbi:MAG: purine-nucleoside phosphorylase [Ignavibacteriales bacterium]|nr:purine-nucleoside phosphorylase [Ignavibacteriales bacterium]
MINLNAKYRETIEAIVKEIPFEPEICLILGSGLGDFAEKVETVKSISTAKLPNYPISTVQGHQGYLHFSKYHDKKLLIVQGRIHFYEGYTLSQCVLPVHVASKLNCKKIILTNAAGGVNPYYKPGDLMLASSLNGISIKTELTELIGLASLDQKNELLDFPSQEINGKIKSAALQEKIPLQEGVYWLTKGPSYETPAEIKMIRKFGGDAVGMSTVHEAIYAASIGLKAAAISCVTNYAAGLSDQKLSHKEVMETAERVKHNFERLVKKAIELL